jgi:phosphatidyl-myo-inositol dimannoside synthase
MVLTDAFLPHAGGSREYYYNIYREFSNSHGNEVTVLTKKVPGWRTFDTTAMAPHFRIRRCFRPLRSWKYHELPKGIAPFLQALWVLIWDRPDIIHAGDLYPQGLSAYLFKRFLGIPYAIYCHGEEITQTDRFRYQPRVRNRVYRYADAVIANSEFSKQQLLRIGVSELRIHKITPGIDARRFHPGPRVQELVNRYRLKDRKVILTVGRLVPRKGHRAALEAFAKVHAEFPEAHYLIVGTGPEEERIRAQIAELGLHECVTLAGIVSAEQLPEHYRLCDIMLLANRQEADGDIEGFGIVFLEASASGKPVIGGRSGGATEAVKDGLTGLLVDPDDSGQIVNALRQLLTNSNARQVMGREGRRIAESDFTWEERATILHRINCGILNSTLDNAAVGMARDGQPT